MTKSYGDKLYTLQSKKPIANLLTLSSKWNFIQVTLINHRCTSGRIDREKFVKNWEKEGENQEKSVKRGKKSGKRGKTGKVLSFCPS